MKNEQQIKQAIFDKLAILPIGSLAIQPIGSGKNFYFHSPELLMEKIYAAIAPLINESEEQPKDLPYSELFDHMANEHGLTLTNTELGDIIHIARGK